MNKTLRKQILNALFNLQDYHNDAEITRDYNTGCYTAADKRRHRQEGKKIEQLIEKVTMI
jgi:hypothetical protein